MINHVGLVWAFSRVKDTDQNGTCIDAVYIYLLLFWWCLGVLLWGDLFRLLPKMADGRSKIDFDYTTPPKKNNGISICIFII